MQKEHSNSKIKYKAKRLWTSWYESIWEKIEICNECLNKIIKAKEEEDNNA